MRGYIDTMKNLIDHIVFDGDHISDGEQILYFVGGFRGEYNSIITNFIQKKRIPYLMRFSVL